jgi:enolase-phosphatase E1
MKQSTNESMIKAILLDIEGTTTPINFVHKTLFPFAKAKLNNFVRENFDQIKDEISQLKTEYKLDFQNQIYGRKFDENSPESVSNYLKFLIEVDRKSTPLKNLQGKIWQAGYETGELKSEVFADVASAFECWKSQNKKIAIYSLEGILAQKLLLAYTNFGDLNSFISNYFDTNFGDKKESESYQKIAKEMKLKPAEILFVSDSLAELDAAQTAGLQTLLSIRAGNGIVQSPINHDAIASFEDLKF